MRLPCVFTRRVGGSGSVPLLGSDTLPAGNAANQDNVLESESVDPKSGTPVLHLGLAFAGPSGSPTVTVTVFVYEETLAAWVQVATAVLTSGVVSTVAAFTPIVAGLPAASGAAKNVGNPRYFVQAALPGGSPPSGNYIFGVCPLLS